VAADEVGESGIASGVDHEEGRWEEHSLRKEEGLNRSC
jgi:hypothetical protein